MQSCLDNSSHQNLQKSPLTWTCGDLTIRDAMAGVEEDGSLADPEPGPGDDDGVLTAAESRSLWRWPRCLVAEKWTPSADGGPITGRLTLCRPITGGLASLCQPIATQYSVWSCPLLFFDWLLVLFTPGFTHQNVMRFEQIKYYNQLIWFPFRWQTSTHFLNFTILHSHPRQELYLFYCKWK